MSDILKLVYVLMNDEVSSLNTDIANFRIEVTLLLFHETDEPFFLLFE